MKHLFFNPIISDFQAVSKNGKIVCTEDRKLISNDTTAPSTFLGVKPCLEFTGEGYVQRKDIFLVRHEVAYQLAQKLYEKISGVKPSWGYFSNSENMDWALFLVSSDTSIDKIKTDELLAVSNSKKQSFTYLTATIENDQDNRLLPFSAKDLQTSLTNFDLIIGVQNGYDSDDEITFYVAIKHKEYEKGCYLTIGSYKFSHQIKIEFVKSNADINILIRAIENEATLELKKELQSFKMLYTHLYGVQWKTIRNDFVPVCLDILNYNRSIESIKNDKQLQNDINNTKDSSLSFFNLRINKNRSEFAMLLDFVIYSNHFDLKSFQYNRKKTEQIFVQKKSYKTIRDRIINVVKDNTRILNYLQEQNDIYLKIEKHLK